MDAQSTARQVLRDVPGIPGWDEDAGVSAVDAGYGFADYLGTGPMVSALKTRAARRTVTIPCSVAGELEAFVKANPPATGGLIFHADDGTPTAHVAVNHIIQRAAKRAGMRPVHAHLLRHTAVSLLIHDGANPKAIQAFVGHSDIKMTLGVYGHLFDYGAQALADSLERRREAHRNGGA